MTKGEDYHFATIGTLREGIKHYGTITPCFDLHPHQVQPSHIVITSPWFETKDCNFGKSPKPRAQDLERRRQRALRMEESGYTYTEIGVVLGIACSNARQMCARWRKV